jgi:hypothetical protein
MDVGSRNNSVTPTNNKTLLKNEPYLESQRSNPSHRSKKSGPQSTLHTGRYEDIRFANPSPKKDYKTRDGRLNSLGQDSLRAFDITKPFDMSI